MNYTKCQQGIPSLASTLILDMLPTVYFQHTLWLINPNRVIVVCSFLIILQRVHHLF